MEQSPDKNIESQREKEIILSSERAVERVKEIYDILGPKLGANFVEANIILTLADARGQTEIFIDKPEAGDKEAIDDLNAVFESKGVRFDTRIITSRRTKKPVLMVNVESLQGYVIVSRQSKIPGIKPFDPTTGWEGLSKWLIEINDKMEDKQKKGLIPRDFSISDVIVGIIKGYPDTAVYDASDAYGKNAMDTLVSTHIAHVDLYGGAEPNYDYYPEHVNLPEIIEHEKLWGNILENFYNSDFHENLKKDQEFIEAKKIDKE